MDQVAMNEFYWLHAMNVALGIATVVFMIYVVGSILREIAHHLGR